MDKNLEVNGKDFMDIEKRYAALEALQKNATTEELQKLQKGLKNPMYRKMLNHIK